MEKRVYPRIEKQFSVVVENDKGVKLNVVAVDTSSDGVCIQCNTFERNLITPGGCFISDGKPVELFLRFELPFGTGKVEKVNIRCHVAFSRRISSDQCKIGMRYIDLDEDVYSTLVKYIELAVAA